MVLVGCDQAGSSASSENAAVSDTNSDDSITATEIMRTVVSQYSEAATYQDKAVLYLTYRLNKRAIQEPHPWSIAWDKNGRLAADLFNTKIRDDGKNLSCYVFDIESGNVDNQHLLIPDGQFRDIANDPIARHFVFGASELPLHDPENKSNWLLPPLVGFADATLMPEWLNAKGELLKRLADDDSLGMDCYVVQATAGQKIYRIWIDQTTGMVQQIHLPLEYLDSQILASEDVGNLAFFVRFHDARLNEIVDEDMTEIPQRIASKTVRQFVTLPQSLPCERVGEVVSKMPLKTIEGKNVEMAAVQSSATVMLWIGGDSGDEVEKFVGLAKQLSAGSTTSKFAVVYSDDLLAEPGSSNARPNKRLLEIVDDSKVSTFYDPQLNVSSFLKIKAVPMVIVFDADKRIQYAKALDDEKWQEDVRVALKRVADGDDVAAEMKSEYQEFLDEYHRKLVLAGSPTVDAQVVGESAVTKIELSDNANWEFDAVSNPGNIHVPVGSERIFVVDGWQTIVELNAQGQLVKKHNLQLPENTAINRIRSAKDSQDRLYFAAYSMLGKKVFIFDDAWKRLAHFPSSDTGSGKPGITECQFIEVENSMRIWVSFFDSRGVQEFDIASKAAVVVSETAAKSFCKCGKERNGLFIVAEESLTLDSQTVDRLADWKCVSVRPSIDENNCVVVTTSNTGEWRLKSLAQNGNENWSNSISSQYFENEIDPLSFSSSANGNWVLVASPSDVVHVMGSDNGQAYTVSASAPLLGMAMVYSDGSDNLVISDGKRISCYNVAFDFEDGPFVPISATINK